MDQQKITMESDLFQLDDKYSTTRRVTKAQPVIVNNTEDKVQSVLFLPDNRERKAEGGLRTQGYFKRNETDKPLISVITVVFNGAEYLEQTILSVIEQAYDNVEYIIIDGGSTDGTMDIIRQYEKQIDYWVSEPDEGIADAFNKGISLCTGEIIGIINADDWYEDNIFEEVFLYEQYDVIHGQLQYWKDGVEMEIFVPNQKLLDKEMTMNHPTCFVRKDVYKKFGAFNPKYKIAMDYDFLLRVMRHKAKFYYLPRVLANMRYCGVSDINWILAYKDSFRVKVDNKANYLFSMIYFIYQVTRRYVRILLEKVGLNGLIRIYRDNFSVMTKL